MNYELTDFQERIYLAVLRYALRESQESFEVSIETPNIRIRFSKRIPGENTRPLIVEAIITPDRFVSAGDLEKEVLGK